MKKASLISIIILFIILLFLPLPTNAEGKIVINEFLAHPTSGNKEWIEFYNPDKIDLSNYWVDDDTDFSEDKGNASKKSLSILNTTNPEYPYIELSSFLNNDGDHVVLFNTNGDIVDQYEYTKDPGVDIVFGRSPNGDGSFQTLKSPTLGNQNSETLPTATPTTSPSPTQTDSPTPVKPTMTKVPTPTKASTIKQTSAPTVKAIIVVTTKIPTIQMTIISASATPSARQNDVLGESTKSATEMPTASPKKQILVKNLKIQQNSIAAPLAIGCAIILISCAILAFLKIKKSNHDA